LRCWLANSELHESELAPRLIAETVFKNVRRSSGRGIAGSSQEIMVADELDSMSIELGDVDVKTHPVTVLRIRPEPG
jgi:hypothetical protein